MNLKRRRLLWTLEDWVAILIVILLSLVLRVKAQLGLGGGGGGSVINIRGLGNVQGVR